jgi:hypothetical protein
VLAAARNGCNLDFDALLDLANEHRKLRRMLGLVLQREFFISSFVKKVETFFRRG